MIRLPKGWRQVRVGEIIRKGDLYFMDFDYKYSNLSLSNLINYFPRSSEINHHYVKSLNLTIRKKI